MTPMSIPSTWQLDHIGIAVSSLDTALEQYETLLATQHYGREHVDSQGVEVAFLDTSNARIELLAPLSLESSVAKFINKRGEGMHHTAFLVNDIQSELDRLSALGLTLFTINRYPAPMGNGWHFCIQNQHMEYLLNYAHTKISLPCRKPPYTYLFLHYLLWSQSGIRRTSSSVK